MHISEAGGRTIAADLESAFTSVDAAILDAARLTTSIMETKQATVIPPARFQHVVEAMSSTMAKIVEGRKDMVSAHRSLAAFKGESNLAETGFGCFRAVRSTGPIKQSINA